MMKKQNLVNIYLGLATIFLTSMAAIGQSLSLPDAINIALKNNLEVELLKNNVEISNTNNYIGVAGGLPLVSATAGRQICARCHHLR